MQWQNSNMDQFEVWTSDMGPSPLSPNTVSGRGTHGQSLKLSYETVVIGQQCGYLWEGTAVTT